MHFNDFTNNLSSNAKVFADDTLLFSVVFNIGASAKELNDNLSKVQYWAFKNDLDITKQAQEVIFSKSMKKSPHPSLIFNSNQVNKTSS